MNTGGIRNFVIGRFVWLLLAVLLARTTATAARVEENFPVLKTRTATYTNATITTATATYVMVLHSAGLASVKIPDLPLDVQRRLGYAPDPQLQTNNAAAWAKRAMSRIQAPKIEVGQILRDYSPRAEFAKIVSDRALLYTILGVGLAFYLFYSYCLLLICRKANYDPGILIWVPVLQFLPMLYAARMSAIWFFACIVPVLNIVAQIVWAINIAKARGKSPWTALWLLLPITSLFAFLYLAFSSSAPEEKKEKLQPGKGRELMDLQVA